VNLSEAMGSVPGLQIQNRQNYAQDLQLSIRGFGARSTFGVRGVRIYVDGVPATMPDGQGQTSNIDISSTDRVEVLRGPFSALYGNSSGGVVQVFTEDGEGPPRLGFGVAAGSYGTWRESAQVSGSTGSVSYLLSGSHFETDGYREHSAAQRNIINGKLGIALGDDSKLTVVMNGVRLRADDPLGLTPAQYAQDPRSAAVATQYNTRKTVDQMQAGLIYEKRLNADNDLRLLVYDGERSTVQYQAIPPSAQVAPTSAGGVIDLHRDYGGIDARWITRGQLAGRPFDFPPGWLTTRSTNTGAATRTTPAPWPTRRSACVGACGATKSTRCTTWTRTCKANGALPINGASKRACATALWTSIRAISTWRLATATTAARPTTTGRCRWWRYAIRPRRIFPSTAPGAAATKRRRSTNSRTAPVAPAA
jgi:outer membrane receptor protein involved in Fe transport